MLAFPTWISATHANATDLTMRQALLDNLIDEERGPDNHPELWLRFCDAALYAYESQQPEVMTAKRAGLRDLYGVPAGHEYFEVHEAADVEHGAAERALLTRYGAGQESALLAAARTALEATYTILNGVERQRGAIRRGCASPGAHPA